MASSPREKLQALYTRAESLIGLARESDILFVASRAVAANAGQIDGAVLEALGPRGVLINVSRGLLVDEAALIRALESRMIAGAALDVFAQEPTEATKWRGFENLVLSPHVAGYTQEAGVAMFGQLRENLRRYFAGEALLTPVEDARSAARSLVLTRANQRGDVEGSVQGAEDEGCTLSFGQRTGSAHAMGYNPAMSQFSAPVLILTGLCALVYFLDGLIHSVLGPLAPDMARSLQLTNTQLGPIFSANLMGQCIGLMVFPLLSGRLGQRQIVLICLVGFGIAQAATALATGPVTLVAWRLITGAFLGGCLPSCLALVTAAAPAARRGLAIMILFTGYGLGATVAGLVATGFAELGGWRMAMVAVGGACLVTAVFAWLWLVEVRSGDGGAAARPEGPAAKPNALLILSPRYLVGTLMLWLLFISMLTISYCLNSWLPTLLVEVGRSERFAAMSVSVFSLGGIIAALGVGVLIDRLGAMRTLASFLVISTVMLFVIGQVLATASAEMLMALLVVCGFFILGAYGGVNVVLASFYPDRLRAVGIGWTKSVGRIGTLIAPVLIGAGLAAGMAETTIMSLFAVPAALSVVALLAIGMSARRANEPHEPSAIPIARDECPPALSEQPPAR